MMLVTSKTADGQVNLTDEAKAAGYQLQSGKVLDKSGVEAKLNDKGETTEDGVTTQTVTMTQVQLDQMFKDRLEQQKRQFDQSQEDANTQAQLDAQAAQGKHEERANTLQSELTKLKPKADAYERLATTLNESIDAVITQWPKEAEEIKDMDPGKDNVEGRQKWFSKATIVVDKLRGKKPESQTPPLHEGGDQQKPDNKTVGASIESITGRYKLPEGLIRK